MKENLFSYLCYMVKRKLMYFWIHSWVSETGFMKCGQEMDRKSYGNRKWSWCLPKMGSTFLATGCEGPPRMRSRISKDVGKRTDYSVSRRWNASRVCSEVNIIWNLGLESIYTCAYRIELEGEILMNKWINKVHSLTTEDRKEIDRWAVKKVGRKSVHGQGKSLCCLGKESPGNFVSALEVVGERIPCYFVQNRKKERNEAWIRVVINFWKFQEKWKSACANLC